MSKFKLIKPKVMRVSNTLEEIQDKEITHVYGSIREPNKWNKLSEPVLKVGMHIAGNCHDGQRNFMHSHSEPLKPHEVVLAEDEL